MQQPENSVFESKSGAFGQSGQTGMNWLGLYTLFLREVRRFMKVYFQTVVAPVASTLLFMMVFTLGLGSFRPQINGIDFAAFIAPGLIMMSLLTNAFANASSSLITSKMQGNSVDYLMPPLGPLELTMAFIGGAAIRGLLVACAATFGIWLYAGLAAVSITHGWAILYFGFCAAIILGAAGLITGIWAEKFDHLAAINNFLITPLTFLSGTFYSIRVLYEPLQKISLVNPFFYLIDGFRYGFTGQNEASLLTGVAYTAILAFGMVVISYLVLRSGWRLKS